MKTFGQEVAEYVLYPIQKCVTVDVLEPPLFDDVIKSPKIQKIAIFGFDKFFVSTSSSKVHFTDDHRLKANTSQSAATKEVFIGSSL